VPISPYKYDRSESSDYSSSRLGLPQWRYCVTTMVADTAMLRGPAVLGGPARPTITNIVGKKCELFISFTLFRFVGVLGPI